MFKKGCLLIISLVCLTGCKAKINEFPANMICTKEYTEEVEGMIYESTSKIYLDYDENNLVTKAVFQSISPLSNYNESYILAFENLMNIENEVKGVESNMYKVDEKLVLENTYDYTILDIVDLKKRLGDILDLDGVLTSAKLPVTLEEYQKLELEDYECEVKK